MIFMCAYAGDVALGRAGAPYSDEDARHYARACLVPPELLERAALDIDRAPTRSGCPPTIRGLRAPSTRGARPRAPGV